MNNWNRAQLKNRAKEVLRQNYWIAFVVALIMAIVAGGGSGAGGSSNYSFGNEYQTSEYKYNDVTEIIMQDDIQNLYSKLGAPFMALFAGIAATAVAFYIGIKIFLLNPLAAGCHKFFSSSAETPHSNMAPVGIAFKNGNYWGIVKGMIFRDLYIFLWTLLFIIPGIIKSYSYRMVPYILTDNPQMDANEAITLSRKMMNNEKFDTFVLDLSFIGWYLLGLLACGVGVLFVNPYKFSTDAQLYLVLRDKAINNNFCTPGALNLIADL